MTMTAPASVDLAGRRVLVVEDHFLIALDMEVMLRALGARVVDLASGIGDALAAIERCPPDFAILDLKLGTKATALPIAEALLALAIPFVVVTGYDDFTAIPASMQSAPVIRKPVPFGTLQAVLATLSLSIR
jgi:CheY-like chemotaxis protein